MEQGENRSRGHNGDQADRHNSQSNRANGGQGQRAPRDRSRRSQRPGKGSGLRRSTWKGYSPEQLDELAQHGLTRLVDDNPNSREWNVLSKETLADFSMQKPERTLADLPWPVLMVHGVLSNELPDTAEATAEGFPLLPDSSQMVHVHAETLDQAQEEVARLSLEWARRRLR